MTQAVAQKTEVKIGEYVLTGKIGQGGIAEIYKGRQESLDRDVAIKVLSAKLCSNTELVRRFERESIVIARLNHPNIVHIIDKGKAGNRYYFVMEFVDGTSLREVIDSDKVPLKTKLEMIGQVCKALDYAHKNGIIHRDIKPTNILIDRQGNARVADFGIAQIIGAPDAEMTSSDVVMGTLAYMSPEQKESSTNVDQTTDIYATGVILYEILVGKKPLGRFRMPSEINPRLSPAFDKIVQRCLAQEAKDRYQTAVELKNDILDAVGGGSTDQSTDNYAVNGSESFIGKCRYLDTIRETKFSSTILVENRANKRLYVIKKHNKGEAGKKEAKLLSSLQHKNIISSLGAGGDNRRTVIISGYARGGSLAERMVRKYDWRKAINIILEVAAGLDFAHKNNIVHGNVRPSNILFTDKEEIKICDFGLPPHYDAEGRTNWYSPPEHKVSKQGDIYALGVIFHQLVSGRNPTYDAGSNLRMDDISGTMPDDIISILKKLLGVRVAHRYKSCEEMLLDWEDFEQRQQQAESMRKMRRAAPAPQKKQVPAWALVVAVLGLLAATVVTLLVAGAFR
ncbi:MAG: protein kinase [Candidatus Zixiibacteriota bacterium]|nr:MAG: protein kinase [candidate division Zixibacteria bacterium]